MSWGGRSASALAFAQKLAGRAVDQMQPRACRTWHGDMRIGGVARGGQPMLHVQPRLRALEDNLTIHAREYDNRGEEPKLRMFT